MLTFSPCSVPPGILAGAGEGAAPPPPGWLGGSWGMGAGHTAAAVAAGGLAGSHSDFS